MTRILILSFFYLITFSVFGQTTISGTIIDKKKLPIIGASVFIQDTYDGGITDLDGKFSFTTTEQGEVKLVASYLGYETYSLNIDVDKANVLNIVMRESAMSLDAVEITASTFKAGYLLKPIDIGELKASLEKFNSICKKRMRWILWPCY